MDTTGPACKYAKVYRARVETVQQTSLYGMYLNANIVQYALIHFWVKVSKV